MRRALSGGAVALVFLAAGCGQPDGGASTAPGASPTPSAAGTDLSIELRTDVDAEPRILTLTCDPAGGDHPQPDQACDQIAAAAPEVFEPVPDDQPCTMIYGGPQTATITGTFEGEPVDASFSRQNGCEIDRWEQLGTTVFDVPLQ